MLFSRPTRWGAGIIVYGDYNDLRSVYDTVFDLFPEGKGESNLRELIFDFAQKVRHAYEGRSEIYTEPPELSSGTGKYFGFRILWPYFLTQVRLLREAAGYMPTSREHQAILYLLEDCAHNSLVRYDAAIGTDSFERFMRLSRFSGNYLVEYVHEAAREFVCEGRGGKVRFKKLPQVIASLNYYSREYREFREALEGIAKEKKTRADKLWNPTPFCDFKW